MTADLMRVQPAPGSGWVAVRACTTVLAGLSLVTGLGRPELAAYVAFGAFASAYGGSTRTATRWHVQLTLGVLLTLAVVSGAFLATTDHRQWPAVAIATAWAVLASVLSQRYRWRPPGPLFLVFAAATSAAMPVTSTDVWHIAATTAASASLAVVLGLVEVRVLGADSPPPGQPRDPTLDWRLPLICGLSALIAGTLATLNGLAHPSWAMVAAVAPFSVVPLRHQVVRGVHRVAGTAAGLTLAAAILAAGPLPAALLLIVVTALHAATELLVVRHYGLALIAITPLALLLTQLAEPLPATQLLTSRIIETVVGVVVGLAVAMLIQRGAGVNANT